MNTILRNVLLVSLIPAFGSSLIACTSTSPSDSPASPTPAASKAKPTAEANELGPAPTKEQETPERGREATDQNGLFIQDSPRPKPAEQTKKSAAPTKADWLNHLAGLEKTKTLFAQAIFPEAIGHGRGTLGFVPLKGNPRA